jgi:hypothetical protein
MISVKQDETLLRNQYNFKKFVDEHDKRRGTDFRKTFPEFEEFYNFCNTITL